MDPSPLSVNEAFFDEVRRNVRAAIVEDVGSGDINAALISTDQLATAHLITRTAGVFCGQPWADETCQQIDTSITLEWLVHDGQSVTPGDALLVAHGPARSLLTCERIMLNFIQLLSGTATAASQYVEAISETSAKILDTRKTVPGLRIAQKYAVAVAGAKNHRLGLFDAYLIKENHIAAAGGITESVDVARRQNPHIKIEVEVETISQLVEAIEAAVDMALLDNFSMEKLHEAVTLSDGNIQLEASGGITLENVVSIAQTGVNYISVGEITKNIEPMDLSLRFEPEK
ncbi:MAG TPA: carboxylating nicotinate-nucleotide diphosphorylase [Pseudomonadales bacterium]|jgi:nicotinate-nucleotide pyrophosphorylase (carboxylating)|nr:carboxylating nicotinate-nucleotide diphosphorylase [Pseudomonadales bacterium]|tara:strand:- start:8566 stop:9429 length:864 start_codon:yes stop_codon:yes gene_type:complete